MPEAVKPKVKPKKNFQVEPALEAVYIGEFSDSELYNILLKVRNGNFSVRLPADQVGIKGKIYDTLNEIIELNEKMVFEFEQVGNSIGKQGKLTQRVEINGAKGSWGQCVNSVNTLIADLVYPTIEIAHVITSVAKGNLSQQMPLDIEGHALQGEFYGLRKK